MSKSVYVFILLHLLSLTVANTSKSSKNSHSKDLKLGKKGRQLNQADTEKPRWSNDLQCEEDIKPMWRRASPNSKYLIAQEFADRRWKTSVLTGIIKEECQVYHLGAPGVAHEQDWHSLQNVSRYFHDKIEALRDTEAIIATSQYFNTSMQQWVLENNNPSFIIWDWTSPAGSSVNGNKEFQVDISAHWADGKQYIASNDINAKHVLHHSFRGYITMCQYPIDSYCYSNSDEEKATKAITLEDELLSIGDTKEYSWYLLMQQKSFSDSLTFCKDNGKELWTFDLKSPQEEKQLYDLTRPYFIKRDLYPVASFHRSDIIDPNNPWTGKKTNLSPVCSATVNCIQKRSNLKSFSHYFVMCVTNINPNCFDRPYEHCIEATTCPK